jgi:hypothetical protein
MALTKEQIFAADDVTILEVDVPEWGGVVRLKAPTATALDRFEANQVNRRKISAHMANIRARMAILVCVDDDNKPLFTDADESKLSLKSSVPLNRIWKAAQSWLGVDDEAVEEIAKNSQETGDADSSSVSPSL